MAGTPGYFAPELLKGEGHGFPADWWAVGIIMFQLLTGNLPFHSRDQNRQSQMIVEQEPQIPNQVRVPHSDLFCDIVNKLLTKEPTERLGYLGGATEVLNHEWFTNTEEECYIDIEEVKNRRVRP